MKAVVSPSIIHGTITAPASKSAMQRACAAALIKKGISFLHNPGSSSDDKAALKIIEALGASVNWVEEKIKIQSNGVQPVSNKIFCGESGLSARMFTPLAALSNKEIEVDGGGTLKGRPMNFFQDVLPKLDVNFKSEKGFLPFTVMGPLAPQNITVDGSLSSQYLTGLLFAYAAANAKDVTIEVKNLKSRPYVDLTLEVLKAFQLKTPINKEYKEFYFSSNEFHHDGKTIDYTVEGDWSGAAFLLVAAAISGQLTITGLDVFSLQADKEILQALMQTEAIMSIEEKQIAVTQNILKPFHFNAIDCPDLFPPLVALAARCNGTSVIEGVHRLQHKESSRALTLQQEFFKMGVEIKFQDDLMIIIGGNKLNAAVVNSHHDHRIAMACAIAALKADGEVIIEGAEAVNKSYPHFWKHLQELGAAVSLIHN